MSEPTKTTIFVLIAILCVVGVFWSIPTVAELEEGDPTGQLLFPKFTDPLAPASLAITKYNEKTSDVIPFEVAQVDGVWRISSHENYPADAAEHLAEVANLFVGLKILGLASDEPGSQEGYGVVDPTAKDLRPGATGVGTRVVMKDAEGKKLADVIIGKQDPNQPNVRYVRRTDQEMIFSVDLNTDVLTAKFDAWIEKDLLKMNVLDIHDVFIEDYSIDELHGELVQEGKLVVRYDPTSETEKWKLIEDLMHDPDQQKWVSVPMQPHETFDIEPLQQMKTALADLKIVDVLRKPAGLSADLAAEKSLVDNKAAKNSLALHGFYVANVDGMMGIYSNEGEIGVLLGDGVEYVLRFGSIATNSKAAADSEADKNQEGKSTDADTDASGVNRYLLVTVRFNLSAVPRPELQKLPEIPKEEPAEGPSIKDLQEKRAQIERENQWKKDEYQEKIAAGQKRVEELNARFADWYYIISESVFSKLRLSRKDLIKAKQLPPADDMQPPAEPTSPISPGALRKLQEGIDK